MCSICLCKPCLCRCPNYMPPKYDNYCSICGQGILNSEEFLENVNGESIHYECIHDIRWLLNWLGYDIKIEEGNEWNEENY